MRLVVVSIRGGRSNNDWHAFYENVKFLNGQATDYVGINSTAVISTRHDNSTIKLMVAENMHSDKDIDCMEITRETLKADHSPFVDLVENYFLPNGTYPNIE